jgi:SAM-dependent methyltransferase
LAGLARSSLAGTAGAGVIEPQAPPGLTSLRSVPHFQDDLASHPDRLRWNTRYGPGFTASFRPHPLAEQALSLDLPDGPVAELACGPSGSALLAAASGRQVIAVDVSDVALGLLGQEARRRGLAGRIALVHADLGAWRPDPGGYALVLCTAFWAAAVFAMAIRATAPGGVIGWEAFTGAAQPGRPGLPAAWCLGPGEPASLLPSGFTVLSQQDVASGDRRRLLARRHA